MNEHIAGYYDCSDYPREPVTFCGIPIPLTMETILDALVKAELDRTDMRRRQIAAFRSRILRMYAEKDSIIAYWEKNSNENAGILAAKDKRIAELEAELLNLAKQVHKHKKDRMIADKKLAWGTADEILKRMG
jgi:hypothetical protein